MPNDPILIQIQNESSSYSNFIEEAVYNFEINFENIIKLNDLQAKIQKKLFKAYVKEGFDEVQALFLIKNK